ncbi:hypothetical protein [Adhaeretor mobilis]|uniref:Uncharacterized protein n=1 Tax=Adhaeretor mobilis TaxID=1930276 RepID=A0A517MUW2_9BACT|nr:hypothetical protein [Adhaeretor mobilis]QDS98670.1 hypothetical protein HG15A2_19510 [Adhaeretor mobilis]
MTLAQKLLAGLQTSLGQTSVALTVDEGAREVNCKALQCEQLAVTVTDLTLETSELAGIDLPRIQAASQALCSRVNYLLEPISPIETDAQGCTVQMRSNPPQQDDNGCRYYELLLRRGGSVALHRYEKQPGKARVRVPAVLTHEVLGRLVDDFSQAVDGI